MLVLGISGGLDQVQENATGISEGQSHDSAAAIVRDGEVVAVFEEERLNRIKHTNKFPVKAIAACLREAGCKLEELDAIAYYTSAQALRIWMHTASFGRQPVSALLGLDVSADRDPQSLLGAILRREFGTSPALDRIHFVNHHVAHAHSAYALSGYDDALVVTLDGQGDRESGSVACGRAGRLEFQRVLPIEASIGLFYLNITTFLGLGLFGEYKLMGFAPFGNPRTFQSTFDSLCRLLPDGNFELRTRPDLQLIDLVRPRMQGEPFLPEHADVAAAAQQAAERLVFHLLQHFRTSTGLSDLCLAGGVAHNCSINGKLLASGLFQRMFVQPAAHDAGCAIGAALAVSKTPHSRERRLRHVYLGTNIASQDALQELTNWNPLLEVRRSESVEREAAQLLANGEVCGWVQGRAEFGPRALGNRSILADPRDETNKTRINAIVKKREEFRPFAPAVLAERAADYFDIPMSGADLSHMTYVLNVRPDKRATLAAVTHVDGSARVQTVHRDINERFWSVINEFGSITGVPVLLNTSFNNNAEPIVDSVRDSIVTFLTTDLDFLVVGDWVVRKQELTVDTVGALRLSLPPYARLGQLKKLDAAGVWRISYRLGNSFSNRSSEISAPLYELLNACGGKHGWLQIASDLSLDARGLFAELLDLWRGRAIVLHP